jgi:hypothetical protein
MTCNYQKLFGKIEIEKKQKEMNETFPRLNFELFDLHVFDRQVFVDLILEKISQN